MDWEFNDTFSEYLFERWERRQRSRRVGDYYPSSIWRCLRQEILSWDSRSPPSDQALRHFFAGDLYQDFIIDEVMNWKFGKDMTKIEQRICISIPYTPEENEFIYLRGRIDEMTFIRIGKDLIAVPNEAKTRKSSLSYVKEPQFDHLRQLMAYMGAIGAPYGKLIYMDRSTLQCKTFHVDFDIKIYKEIIERTRVYHSYVLKRGTELPPAEALSNSKSKWKCNFCEYKDFCWKKEGVK